MGDYTTFTDVSDELKGYVINSASVPTSDTVEGWITEAESRIDNKTNNVYSSTTISSEILDWDNLDGIIRPAKSPILSITSLSYNPYNPGDSEFPTYTDKTENTDFFVYGDMGEVEPIIGSWSPSSGKKRFNITYIQGPSSVPSNVKTIATKIAAQRVIGAVINDDATSGGGEVSVGTISVKEPGVFTPTRYKQMGDEIEALFNELGSGFINHRLTREYNI